jgi:type I restriction enzyme S subunit
VRQIERLKRVAHITVSNVDKKSVEGEQPIRLCNYVDVYYNDRITASLNFMEATATADQIARFGLRAGDVLITKDSETADDIAIAARVPHDLPDVVCGYHLAVIRPRPSQIYPGYLYWVIVSNGTRQQFTAAATGVTRFGLRQEAIADAALPIPSTAEQRAIADYLDVETARIDALVAKKGLLIDKLREKRSALVSTVVRRGLPPEVARAADLNPHPRLTPTGIEWLGDVPEHWEVGRIKCFARIESGHTPSRSVDEYWVDCTIPWVSLNDSGYLRTHDYISDTAFMINERGLANSSAHLLPAGVVVFSRDATVGLCAITTRPMAVSQHFIAYVCGPRMHPAYLLLVLKAMGQHLESLSLGATIATIGMDDIRSLTCPLPSIPEQRAIADYLERECARIDRLVAKVEASIERLQEYRAALITSAVSGELGTPGVAA